MAGHEQSASSVAWECSVKVEGGLLPRLNSGLRPISHKYREGKVKRTLKRESNRARNHDDGSPWTLHKWKPAPPGPSGLEGGGDAAGTQLCLGALCPPTRGVAASATAAPGCKQKRGVRVRLGTVVRSGAGALRAGSRVRPCSVREETGRCSARQGAQCEGAPSPSGGDALLLWD